MVTSLFVFIQFYGDILMITISNLLALIARLSSLSLVKMIKVSINIE